MAGVPKYDEPRVNPTDPNDARFQAPDTSAFTENGRELQQFGQSLQQAGDTVGKIYQHEQDKANDLRVIDAENKAREAAINLTIDKDEGYSNIKGGDVMDVNGQPLADTYRAKYQAALGDIMGGLSNDAQRQAFQRSAATLGESFYAKAREYEASEYQGWQQSVVKGSATLAAQEIALNYSDSSLIDQRLGALDVSVEKLGKLNGKSGNEIVALQNTARSEALTQAIGAALDADDTSTAQDLFDRYKDKMLAPDIGKVEGVLKRETMGKTALAIGDAVFNDIPGAGVDQPTFEKVFSALINQESRGHAGVAGPMTQYGQAHGLTQVLDSTGAGIAKKLGIQWRPDLMRGTSQEARDYQTQIGRAYFQEGLQKYGGDFYKALCYYHGGPDEKKWGAKTHGYADAILAKCGVKQGSMPKATLEDAIASGRRMLEAVNPNASYDQIKAVEEEISRRWSVHRQSQDYSDEQTTSQAMTELLKNGGDISKLKPSLRNAIPGDKWDSILAFSRSVKTQGQERDPKADDAAYNLAITNPNYLKGLPDSAFLAQYAGHPKFEEIAKYRGQLQGKIPVGEKTNPGTLSYSTINNIVDSRMTALGVPLKDSKGHDNPDVQGQLGAVRRTINSLVAGEQRRLGRAMTDTELEGFIDKQFARPGVVNTKSFLGIPTSHTAIPLLAVTVDHIPHDELRQIDDALDRAGQPKTDANRLSLYYAHRSGN